VTEHRIDVNTVVGVTHTEPGVYRSHCTCGWSSQQMRSRALAEGEGDDHVVYMTSVNRFPDEENS
jgi:hypothetical protein